MENNYNVENDYDDDLYEHHRFEAGKGQSPLRVDKYLMNRIENATRNKIQAEAKDGSIYVNDTPVKSNYKVKPLDKIRVLFEHPPYEYLLTPENIPLDIVESNINRQIHALDSTDGESKIKAMKDRIIDINPTCVVDCIDDFLEESNIESHISSRFDFIIDAIDQSSVKTSLAEYCQSKHLSLIMVGGAGGRVDPARIKIAD